MKKAPVVEDLPVPTDEDVEVAEKLRALASRTKDKALKIIIPSRKSIDEESMEMDTRAESVRNRTEIVKVGEDNDCIASPRPYQVQCNVARELADCNTKVLMKNCRTSGP